MILDIIHTTGRKRETYQVQLTHSLLWECALGIAAVTNESLLHTLEKTKNEWDEIKRKLSLETLNHLDYVQKNNTWKALLQLLHQRNFNDLSSFITYIRELPEQELKFISIPYVGARFQELRQQAARRNKEAIKELKEVTKDNPFFPAYIEFISLVDTKELKVHLIAVMSDWYEVAIQPQEDRLHNILKRDTEAKGVMKDNLEPEAFVEWATGGVTYRPEPSVHRVLLIPQYTYRPWNVEADIEGTKVFYYPISSDSIDPNDVFKPDHFLVQRHKALGDETRLRMVKLLYHRDCTLQELTDQLGMGKTTVHHHLKLLRSAKLVDVQDSKYVLKVNTLRSIEQELEQYLNR